MVRSTASLWLARADEQLYRAKAEGRNRACLEQAPEVEVSADEKSLPSAPHCSTTWKTMNKPDARNEPTAPSLDAAPACSRSPAARAVGKTFVSANLAAALAMRGERVLVLDADLGLANLDVVLNLYPKTTLHDVFTGRAALEDAIVPAPGGFSVLLAGSGHGRVLAAHAGAAHPAAGGDPDSCAALRPHPARHRRRDLRRRAVLRVAGRRGRPSSRRPTAMTDAYATVKVLRRSSSAG